MKAKARNIIYHVISIAVLLGSLAFTVLRFDMVFLRTWEAIQDLFLSLAYFCTEWFAPGLIKSTVTTITPNAIALFPIDWETFMACLERVGQLLIDKRNFFDYLARIFLALQAVSLIILPIFIIAVLLILLLWLAYKPRKGKRKKGTSSKPYEIFDRFRSAVLHPIWNFFDRYKRLFLKRWKWYRIAFILIWIFNLNLFTVIIEAFAYIFYLGKSNDFLSIYTQLIKLVLDLCVPATFLPIWMQVIIGWKVFHSFRCWIATKKLRKYTKKILNLLEEIPGSIFVNGKQRVGKTTFLAVLQRIEAIRQRNMAKKQLKARAKQFPHFPWRNLERTMRIARKRHICYTLASTREYIREVRKHFENRNLYLKEKRRRVLQELRRKGYCGDNFIFGYKFEKFPLKYNDGIRIVDIYDCVEQYARTYFIYTTGVFGFGNFSVRFDEKKKTVGNFEKYDTDFFNRKPENMKRDSRYSHYAVGDSMRLGKLMDPHNPYKDAMEFGVVAMTEFEKEVGNQHTNGAYKVDAAGCNRKNDGLSNFLKTCTHMATVDNKTYFRFMCDGQRPGSMAADYAELCTLWRLKKRSDSKIILPFFALEEAVCLTITKLYDALENRMSYMQGKRTLLMYLIDTVYHVIFRWYDRIRNKFSAYKLTADIWDGADNEMLKKGASICVPEALAYADLFATDSWGEFWHEKTKRSKYGIDDIPQFKSKKMSFDEMMAIGSHIYNEMGELMRLEAFLEARKQRDKLLEEEKKKKAEAPSS